MAARRSTAAPSCATSRSSLTSLEHLVYLPYLDPDDATLPVPSARHWRTLFERPAPAASEFEFAQVPFDHPLWIAVLLRHDRLAEADRARARRHHCSRISRAATFHFDLHPGDRVFFFTTSGWMLWNFSSARRSRMPCRCSTTASGVSRARCAVEDGGRGGVGLLRREPDVCRSARAGGDRAERALRSREAATINSGRLARHPRDAWPGSIET